MIKVKGTGRGNFGAVGFMVGDGADNTISFWKN
jgi:hypothetical protein